jgi:hypothetical protein
MAHPEEADSITWNEDHVQPPLLPLVVDASHCVPPDVHEDSLSVSNLSLTQS